MRVRDKQVKEQEEKGNEYKKATFASKALKITYHLRTPCDKVYSILGSTLGSPFQGNYKSFMDLLDGVVAWGAVLF